MTGTPVVLLVVLAVVVGAGAEQVAREPAPRAVGCAVIECLCRGDRPLADDAGQDGSSDDGAARCVLLDDGVDAAGDARAGGNAPGGAEDDGERERVRHESASAGVDVGLVLASGGVSPVVSCR